jgi:hypothetical protein
MAKNIFKPGDRFSHKDGYGYSIGEGKAILFEPKSGAEKYTYIAEIPEGSRFVTNCPAAVNVAMNALDTLFGESIILLKPELVEEAVTL